MSSLNCSEEVLSQVQGGEPVESEKDMQISVNINVINHSQEQLSNGDQTMVMMAQGDISEEPRGEELEKEDDVNHDEISIEESSIEIIDTVMIE